MRRLIALLAGLLFGAGLIVSGMTQPANVRAFLDLFGAWDPSLMFVMGGAIGVHACALFWILKRQKPMYAARFFAPTKKAIDARLVGGAAVFGVGWGLGGFCPGPALVGVGGGATAALPFTAGMVLGIGAEYLLFRRKARASR
jgi:uncharacterized protein